MLRHIVLALTASALVLAASAAALPPYVSSHEALPTWEWTPLESGEIDELAILVSVRHV